MSTFLGGRFPPYGALFLRGSLDYLPPPKSLPTRTRVGRDGWILDLIFFGTAFLPERWPRQIPVFTSGESTEIVEFSMVAIYRGSISAL